MLCLMVAVLSLAGPRWQPPPDPGLPALGSLTNTLPAHPVAGWKPDYRYLGSVRFDTFVAHRWTRRGEPEVRLLIGADHRLDPLLGVGSRKAALAMRGAVEVDSALKPPPPMRGVEVLVVRTPAGLQLVYFWEMGRASLLVETLRATLGLDRSPLRRAGRTLFVRFSTGIEEGPAGLVRARSRLNEHFEASKQELQRLGALPSV